MNLTRVTSTRADLDGRTREWVTPVGVVREVMTIAEVEEPPRRSSLSAVRACAHAPDRDGVHDCEPALTCGRGRAPSCR